MADFKRISAAPVYEQIAAHLREWTASGRLGPDQRLPPEPELAQELGVSRGTLRKALDVLERQEIILRRKGKGTFVARLVETPPARKRLGLLGATALASHDDMFWTGILKGIQAELGEERGVELNFMPGAADPFAASRISNLDGVFLSPDSEGAQRLAGPELNRIPHVIVSASFPEFFEHDNVLVGTDNFEAATEVMDYLLKLGHRRIAHVTLALNRCSLRDRLRAFQAALKKARLSSGPEWVCDFTGGQGVDEQLRRLLSAQKPTAVFCSGLALCLDTMRVAREMGMEIPRDLSLATFDDYGLGAMVSPALTGAVQPVNEVGRAAARMLLRQLRGKPLEQRQVTLKCKLHIRASCQAPRQG
ncbi:MAG TPA: GntR family transcriptional regulator [Candidatus Brocadiia bacterium]|nr:GntR family transcriptional regulator [Candidatus Brocadiia bacterium]